jgi:hypothetical protein
MLRRGSDGYARCWRPSIQRQAPQASPQSVVSGDKARQENRQKIHVVNGRSISLGHAEVKSPKRGAKSSLGGLSIELVKQLGDAASHAMIVAAASLTAPAPPHPGRRRTVSLPGSVKGCPKGRRGCP